jgi:hypothetical protein
VEVESHHLIIYRLLDRHGWRKVVPRPFHANAKKEIQEDFKKKLPEKIAEILADRDPEDTRPVAYVPQDEGRFGRISDPRRRGPPKGVRPRVPPDRLSGNTSMSTPPGVRLWAK